MQGTICCTITHTTHVQAWNKWIALRHGDMVAAAGGTMTHPNQWTVSATLRTAFTFKQVGNRSERRRRPGPQPPRGRHGLGVVAARDGHSNSISQRLSLYEFILKWCLHFVHKSECIFDVVCIVGNLCDCSEVRRLLLPCQVQTFSKQGWTNSWSVCAVAAAAIKISVGWQFSGNSMELAWFLST